MSRKVGMAGIVLLTLGLSQALGHDTGFGHSRRTIIFSASPEGILFEYRIALYADQALMEMALMDRDGDGQISPKERDGFFADRARELARAWTVTTSEGERLEPTFVRCELGHSLTQSYRFRIATQAGRIHFADGAFSHKPGQVAVLSGPGLKAEPETPADLFHIDHLKIAISRTDR